MKFKVTCRYPKELSLVATILLIVGALIVGCLIGDVIVGLYGDAMLSFIETHAAVLAPMAGFAIWFGTAWIAEGITRESSQNDRNGIMVLAMIMSFFTAGMGGLLTVESQPPYITLPLPDPIFVVTWTLVLIGSFVAGWAAHWCKRCVKIEHDEGGAAS
jgi:hypothetical protein